jgi:UDP:flavonoid glycosyltransferase YjiC (YdhE family)
VARRLLPDDVTPEAVRREVDALLHDRSLREAATRLQGELAAMPGPEAGVALIERLAAERQPLVTTSTSAPA